jgi:hypothetical protein
MAYRSERAWTSFTSEGLHYLLDEVSDKTLQAGRPERFQCEGKGTKETILPGGNLSGDSTSKSKLAGEDGHGPEERVTEFFPRELGSASIQAAREGSLQEKLLAL